MELNERISLARKNAGLSQEQLGDKLGVSRQAVSKWESGQTNPDVAYIAEMCRLFGVSSDWLLLGEESARDDTPARCPSCQAAVTGLDKYCPNCGRALKDAGNAIYTLVLRPTPFPGVISDKLLCLSRTCSWVKSDSPLYHLSNEDAVALAQSAPVVLARGLTALQARQAAEEFSNPDDDVAIYRDPAHLELNELERRQPPESRGELPQPPREPMSFGGVVAAVVVGILVAVVLLSFL